MSANLIRYLEQVQILDLMELGDYLPEIRQSDAELSSASDEEILHRLGTVCGYYMNQKIFLNFALEDSVYQETLVHELEHYRHRRYQFDPYNAPRGELIAEIMAYHVEDLWKNPDLKITRGYLRKLIRRVRKITQSSPCSLSITDLPLPSVDLT